MGRGRVVAVPRPGHGALIENSLRADADFGTVIDFLKNLAIMGGLLLVVLRERDAGR